MSQLPFTPGLNNKLIMKDKWPNLLCYSVS
jgi:hypothetical protein